MPEDTKKVKVDGEEASLHITDQSVMFEKGGRVSGFERSTIRMVKPDGDAMIIAYSVGSKVESVRVEPMTAVASLVASSASQAPAGVSITGQDAVFEKLYWDARNELEERLAKVETEPKNKTFRLTPQEDARYSQICRQMESIVANKYDFDSSPEDSPISFWGLEKQPLGIQTDVVKVLHIRFLRTLLDSTAEKSDVVYSGTEVWPTDWPHILERFALGNKLYTTDAFTTYVDYLKSHWKYAPGDKKPALARQ